MEIHGWQDFYLSYHYCTKYRHLSTPIPLRIQWYPNIMTKHCYYMIQRRMLSRKYCRVGIILVAIWFMEIPVSRYVISFRIEKF